MQEERKKKTWVNVPSIIAFLVFITGLIIFETIVSKQEFAVFSHMIVALICGGLVYLYTFAFLIAGIICLIYAASDSSKKEMQAISVMIIAIAVIVQLFFWGYILGDVILYMAIAIPAIVVAICIFFLMKDFFIKRRK